MVNTKSALKRRIVLQAIGGSNAELVQALIALPTQDQKTAQRSPFKLPCLNIRQQAQCCEASLVQERSAVSGHKSVMLEEKGAPAWLSAGSGCTLLSKIAPLTS